VPGAHNIAAICAGAFHNMALNHDGQVCEHVCSWLWVSAGVCVCVRVRVLANVCVMCVHNAAPGAAEEW